MFSLQIEDFVYNRGSGTDREIFITIAIIDIIDIMITKSSSSSSPIIVIKSNLIYTWAKEQIGPSSTTLNVSQLPS